MMKQKVTAIKDLRSLLKDMKGWVKRPALMYSGKVQGIDLRPREIFGNWLICAVLNYNFNTEAFTFTDDPVDGGDGNILNRNTGIAERTEHVFVPHHDVGPSKRGEDVVIERVKHKQGKGGRAYALGKNLVVFFDGGARLNAFELERRVRGIHDFSSVWIAGFDGEVGDGSNQYAYWVVKLRKGYPTACRVLIDFSAEDWSIEPISGYWMFGYCLKQAIRYAPGG